MSEEEAGPSTNVAERPEVKSTCKHRKDLPLKVQVEILTKLMSGTRQSLLATEFKVSQSQISRIKTNQEKIICRFLNNGNLERKRARTGPQKELEEELLKWYQAQTSSGTSITGVTIIAKANQMAEELGLTSWKASKGWFYRWQQRNNIMLRGSHPPIVSLNVSMPEETEGTVALAEIREVLGKYPNNNIYLMDEATLLYRTVPSREGQLFVDPQERVSILFCANRSGTTLMPPVLIGRTAEPSCLKGVKKYPVLYTNSPKATMTSNIFHGWLQQIDADCVKSHKKIVLIADDIPAHRVPQLILKNVRLIYLPFHMRPLERLVSKFKLFYREQLIRELATICDHSIQRVKAASTITLLRAMHYVKIAWGEITRLDVTSTFESVMKTVLGVIFTEAPEDITPDMGILPFNFSVNDLKVIEQLEKKMELEQDMHDHLDETFADDEAMGPKLLPPSKQEIHGALEVLRRLHDLNGYDSQPLYQIEKTLQIYIEDHGLLPQVNNGIQQQPMVFPGPANIPEEEEPPAPQLQIHQSLIQLK